MPVLRTGRLLLTPVTYGDLPELTRLKGDPLAFAQMLGGIRTPTQVQQELAEDLRYWSAHGVGIWAVRERSIGVMAGGVTTPGPLVGLTGLHDRTDGRSPALRFAFRTTYTGRGYAREAAAAALRHAHEAGVPAVYAVTREDNIASRTVLGAIGMRQVDTFDRAGTAMMVYQSRPAPRPA